MLPLGFENPGSTGMTGTGSGNVVLKVLVYGAREIRWKACRLPRSIFNSPTPASRSLVLVASNFDLIN